jgi:hypothetical protein
MAVKVSKGPSMKTYPIQNLCLIASLLTACGLVSASAEDQSPMPSVSPSATASVNPSPSPSAYPSPDGTDACNYQSWNPEIYCFYGARENVTEKVSRLRLKLSEHRVFVQITQGEAWAQVKMFELQKDGTFTVTEWDGKDTFRLACDIDKAIVANKGVNCVGEQMKAAIVKALGKGKVSHSVASPETPAAAFGHSIKAAKGDFIKSEVIVAC